MTTWFRNLAQNFVTDDADVAIEGSDTNDTVIASSDTDTKIYQVRANGDWQQLTDDDE